MQTDVQAIPVRTAASTGFTHFNSLLTVLVALLFAASAQAQQVSQIANLNSGCGQDYLGQSWTCNAGDIAISEITDLIFQGDPTSCVLGGALLIQSATVTYTINPADARNLTLYIGDQQGTDPRGLAGAGSCSAFSLPGPFTNTPDATNPFTDIDGDQCGDIGFSVNGATRDFTDIPITCQDNDDDGFADLQVLLTWDNKTNTQDCGLGTGQFFPTDGGTRSKCDYAVRNTTITVEEPAPGITLDKTTSTPNYDDTSDTIDYSYLVTNSGSLALDFPVTVSDDKVSVDCPADDGGAPNNDDAVLDPGESITCTASYFVSQADIDAGSVTNTAAASADGTLSNEDSVTVDAVQSPQLTVEKSSATTAITAPGIVTYGYLVTNTGNVAVTGIALSDDNDENDMDCPGASLAPGNSFICSATRVVTQGEIDAGGNLSNTVTAASNEASDALDSLDIPIVQTPALSVGKSGTWNDEGSTPGVAEPDETISYAITVENTGNVTLASVSVTDPLIIDPPGVDCTGGNPITDLAPGAVVNCTASYAIDANDVSNGSVANTATATGGGTSANGSDTVALPSVASISLLKSGAFNDDINPDGLAQAGETITYTFAVTNDSGAAVTDVAVSDPLITGAPNNGSIDCTGGNPIPGIAANDTVNCSGTYTLTQADVDAGQVDNTGTASSAATGPVTSDATVILAQGFDWTLAKSGQYNGDPGAATPGDTVSYTLTVANTGFTTLSNILVSDPMLPSVSCTGGNPVPSLAPGASVDCTGDYTVTQTDIDNGQVSNTGTADPNETAELTDNAVTPLPQAPGMTIAKSSGTAQVESTGPLLYAYLVTNTGNVTLTGIVLTDDNVDAGVNCPSASLPAGESMNCSAQYTVTQDDLDAGGGISNNVSGTAAELGEPATASLDIPVLQSPGMTVVKSSTSTTVTEPGPVVYQYVVSNTGNVTLTGLVLSDDNVDAGVSCDATELAPAAGTTCTATHTVTQDELNANGSPTPDSGSLDNNVSATSEQGATAQDSLSIPIGFSGIAMFQVTKDFVDDNADPVEVRLTCNGGLPLVQTFWITEALPVNFVLTDFEPGEVDCRIEEISGPEGYDVTFAAEALTGAAGGVRSEADGCYFDDVTGGQFACSVMNEADTVTVTVHKVWEFPSVETDDIPQSAHITLWCDTAILDGQFDTDSGFYFRAFTGVEGDQDLVSYVLPNSPGSSCWAVETFDSSAIESSSDCGDSQQTAGMTVDVASGDECTITNTVFFEGIPALDRLGLALLALLMLGVGGLAYRRIS